MKNRLPTFLLPLAAAAFLWGAGRLQPGLLRLRTANAPAAVAALENAPPLLVFTTVALGGFRGIVADALWLRATDLQEQGKVMEITQLADWITKLEPRFPDVWTFHAWNMAYNISVMFPDPEDRWRWVQQGLRLLRDEGLKYNPDEPRLYREIGWLFQHKMGAMYDTAHRVYKMKLVQQMAELFDGPRPDYSRPPTDPRVRRMREEYKLDPDVMKSLDEQYGPLDWRLPASHAVYWAVLGIRKAAGRESYLPCERMLFQAMAESFRGGRLTLEPARDLYIVTPNLELLPKVIKTFESAVSQAHDETFYWAYSNFLSEAIMALFCFNRLDEAQRVLDRLHGTFPDIEPGTDLQTFVLRRFGRNIEDTPQQDAALLVESCYYQSWLWTLAGEEAPAAGYASLAELIWNRYMDRRKDPRLRETTALPPLPELKGQALDRLIRETADPALAERLRELQEELAEEEMEEQEMPAPATPLEVSGFRVQGSGK